MRGSDPIQDEKNQAIKRAISALAQDNQHDNGQRARRYPQEGRAARGQIQAESQDQSEAVELQISPPASESSGPQVGPEASDSCRGVERSSTART